MTDRETKYTIAYEEALRAISDQQTALDALQTRAGTVVSAGAIATGLIGVSASRGTGFGLPEFLAIVFLLAIVVLTGFILWPRREWRFHFRSSDLQWNYIEGPNPLDASLMKRDLALHLEAYFRVNALSLDRFAIMLSAAIVLLFLNIGAVVLAIWRN